MEGVPISLLVFLGLTTVIIALANGKEILPDENLSQDEPRSGFAGFLADVGRYILSFFKLIVALMTFDVPGAPIWVRFPFILVINFTLIWVLVQIAAELIPDSVI